MDEMLPKPTNVEILKNILQEIIVYKDNDAGKELSSNDKESFNSMMGDQLQAERNQY